MHPRYFLDSQQHHDSMLQGVEVLSGAQSLKKSFLGQAAQRADQDPSKIKNKK